MADTSMIASLATAGGTLVLAVATHASEAIATGAPLSVDLLYGDHEGGQRTITRFYMIPRHNQPEDDEPWLRLCSVSRHWNIDRADPR